MYVAMGITYGDPILGWMNIHMPPILMFTRVLTTTAICVTLGSSDAEVPDLHLEEP